jgi:hypothetical protein
MQKDYLIRPHNELRQAYRTTTIVCAAMIAALFPYLAVVELVRGHLGGSDYLLDARQIELLAYVLYGLALLPFIVPHLIKRHVTAAAPREGETTLLIRLRTATFLSYALSEVPAVFGLVLFFLAGLHKAFYVLWFLSLLSMLLHFPRLRTWEELTRKANQLVGIATC